MLMNDINIFLKGIMKSLAREDLRRHVSYVLNVAGPNKACCNGAYCCQQDYFSQLQQLPCVSHQPCRDMGYGNFCCPDKSNSTLPRYVEF